MSTKQLSKLCDLLNLGQIVRPPKKVTGGLLHLMWYVITNENEYAIKELNNRIVINDQIKNEYELTERIAQKFFENDVPAIPSLHYNNKPLIEIDDKIFIVYPWLNANILRHNQIFECHASKIGSILAKMHLLKLQFPEFLAVKWDINSNERLCELINTAVKDKLLFAQALKDMQENILSWNTLYQNHISILNNNLVVSHGDLDPKNVLWESNEFPKLIDWESAKLVNPTQEILNLAFDWSGITSGKINLQIFRASLTGYQESGGIIDNKQFPAAFYAIIGNWINWLRYNIERSLDWKISKDEREVATQQVLMVLGVLEYFKSNCQSILGSIP